MAAYLLIASQSPFASKGAGEVYRLAASLARKKHAVTVFLVQNGVLGARANVTPDPFAELRPSGVQILADEFSLRERGIRKDALAPDVAPVDLDVVVDRLAEGHITLWH